jgi:hypothetical protein
VCAVALMLLLLFATVGCGRVPIEVRTAMQKQAAELQQIRTAHRDVLDMLFAQIRTLQLFILKEKEAEMYRRYASGPKIVKLEDGKDGMIYTDPSTAKALPPSGNADLDVIALSTHRLIYEWFEKKGAATEEQLLKRKPEFLKIEEHVLIAQQINQTTAEYLDSLINLRRAEGQLARVLTNRLASIPGVSAVQPSLVKLVVQDTKELEQKLTGRAN